MNRPTPPQPPPDRVRVSGFPGFNKFLRKYNGWIGFVLGTVLFFIAPHIYRQFDPTAGQLDAGFIHPIIYAIVVVSIASAVAWMLTKFTAPGSHGALDKLLEREDDPYVAFFLYLGFFFAFVGVVIAMV